MKEWKMLAALCVILLLAGCKVGGNDSGGSAVGSSGISGIGSGSGSVSVSVPGPGNDAPLINPEPATFLLLGGGLAAYAMLRRKNRKK